MNTNTATLIGGTGLIGSHLLEKLIQDNAFEKIRLILRRPVEFTHPKIETRVINFEDTQEMEAAIKGSSAVFCTIGTTQQKVKGDLHEYRKIDHDIPVNAATICKKTGCETFVLVSTVGADLRSRTFYLKLKAEVEYRLIKMGFNSLYIMRPSMLLGKRNEFRLGEQVMKVMMKIFSGLLVGSTSKFKPIHADHVAAAMLAAAKENRNGIHIWTYKEMKNRVNNVQTPETSTT